jgi:aryl-alcohol dehydrogenase-like predicted oxidoreductase
VSGRKWGKIRPWITVKTAIYETELEPLCLEKGVGVIPYFSLASGFLTGQYHCVPAVVSLAWLIARPSVTAPIASATSLDQLADLIEATKLELNSSSIELLNKASA